MIRLFPMLLLVFSVGVGAETIKYENSKYVGDALNGVPHGQGTLTFSNGDKYVSEWKDDKAPTHEPMDASTSENSRMA
jgi:hypothetical protein